mmetsp:Transcript_11736/g.41097  ORF Transcript_11736/g.41097 Transcript_11736/m.41097 type:complete len:277 (-) Transcript_11736:442-1272(-)
MAAGAVMGADANGFAPPKLGALEKPPTVGSKVGESSSGSEMLRPGTAGAAGAPIRGHGQPPKPPPSPMSSAPNVMSSQQSSPSSSPSSRCPPGATAWSSGTGVGWCAVAGGDSTESPHDDDESEITNVSCDANDTRRRFFWARARREPPQLRAEDADRGLEPTLVPALESLSSMLLMLMRLPLSVLSSIEDMGKSSSSCAGADSVRPRSIGPPGVTGVMGAHGIMRPRPQPKACSGAAPCLATRIVSDGRRGRPGWQSSSSSAPRNIGGRLELTPS